MPYRGSLLTKGRLDDTQAGRAIARAVFQMGFTFKDGFNPLRRRALETLLSVAIAFSRVSALSLRDGS